MHKRILSISSIIFSILFLFSNNISAEISSASQRITTWQAVLTAMWVSYDSGTTWREVFSGTSTVVDIASGASASNTIGTFFSGISLPVGTINRIRVRVRTQLTTRAWILSSGTYYFTDTGTPTTQTGSAGSQAAAEAGWEEITITSASMPTYIEDTETVSITITEGATVNISVVFPTNILSVTDVGGGTMMIMPNTDMNPTITQI